MRDGKPVKIKLVCELTFLKNKDLANSLIVSLIDAAEQSTFRPSIPRYCS